MGGVMLNRLTTATQKYSATARLAALLILGVLTASSVGCGSATPRVIVDNTSSSPMIVKIDGKTAAKIPAHEFQTIPLVPGKYQFEVKSNGREVFKGMRIIEESDSSLASRNYLLCPHSNTGYAVCKVVYGSNAFGELASDAVVKLAEYHTGQKADKKKYAFQKIKTYAEPMRSTTWFEIPDFTGYILRDPPQVAYTRHGGSTSKRALTRISKADHARLKKFHRLENPTEADVDAFKAVTSRALDSLAQLEPTG